MSPSDIQPLVEQILDSPEVRKLGPGWTVHFFPVDEKLADSPLKFTLRSVAGNGTLFGLCSPPSALEFVARAAKRSLAVKQRLSSALAAAVVTPISVGQVSGRSFALYPLLQPMSSHRVWGRLQRRIYRGAILNWLHRAAGETAGSASVEAAMNCCSLITEFPGISKSLSEFSKRAIHAVQNGDWQPKHCLSHNDLWSGNVMLDNSRRSPSKRFRIIDWAGASLEGFPGFDLIRLLHSFGFRHALGRRAVEEHAQIFSWSTQKLGFSLVAALGMIACNLENFPPHRFLQMAEQCVDQFIALTRH